MTVRKLSDREFGQYGCVFEYFEHGERKHCGQPAVAKIGKDGYVCQEHLEYSLSVSPTPLEQPVR